MKISKTTIVVVVAASSLSGAAGYLAGHHSAAFVVTSSPAAGSATADRDLPPVHVADIEDKTVEERVTAYGPVVALPGESERYVAPFQARVRRVHVSPGQAVTAGDPLVDLASSKNTRLQLGKARSEVRAARKALKLVQQRFDMKLATIQDVAAAKQRLELASLEARSLEAVGAGRPMTVHAKADGIAYRTDVQVGDFVPLGAVLVEVVARKNIAVRLGIESEDARYLKTGQVVTLASISTWEKHDVGGTVNLVTHKVNPRTRLVDVYVTPKDARGLLLEDVMRGRLTIRSTRGLVVPRRAVLPMDGKHLLFTERDGVVHRHEVNVGVDGDEGLVVRAKGLAAGQHVVIVGNAELQEGARVRVVEHKP